MFRLNRSMPAVAVVLALLCGAALAQEAVIRKNLPERLPQLPKIDEVNRTPIAGLWEVRYGGTDATSVDEQEARFCLQAIVAAYGARA